MIALYAFFEPATVKEIVVFILIEPAYFSGIENVILTGSVLTNRAMFLEGVMYSPTEMLLKPILPLNGARICVFDS